MLNLINVINGYFEGRALADVNNLKKIEQLRMQMEFDALPEDAKQRVREAAIKRREEELRRRRNVQIGIILGIILIIWLANS